MKEGTFEDEVFRFFLDEVDTVPQMEALLLLWDSRPREWTVDDLSDRLYVNPDTVQTVMAPLLQRGRVGSSKEGVYVYLARPDADRLMEMVSVAYRSNLVRATTIIHSKASSTAAREFARAFKLRKELD